MKRFTLTDKQYEDARQWMKYREKYAGAIGGQFTFEFTPTGLGVITVVKDADDSLDLTEYDAW